MNSAKVQHDLEDDSRHSMLNYWKRFSPSLESMMLDKGASTIDEDERKEILKLLAPVLHNKNVLELGAGIGRYTGILAKVAKSVTAVDFVESYIETNKKNNGHFDNVSWIVADVLDLTFENQKYDVIFSNWLLMYLTDVECIKLMQHVLNWLSKDGYLFIRESCYHSSGNMSRTSNPTHYRSPIDYQNLLETVQVNDCQNNNIYNKGFHIIEAGSIKAYIKHKGNTYQIYFFSQKQDMEANAKDNFQAFLDKKQYSRNSVLRYEWIFGDTFLSTGGFEAAKDFITQLDLKPGQYVLDVGCGVGGHSFYMAEKYGVNILGLDLSANMMSIAFEHLSERPALKDKIKLVLCDVTKADYDKNTFDVIYSRDTLLHIEDKVTLFKNFLSWLKPGGKILFTDYGYGSKTPKSTEMVEYVNQRGYNLLTVNQYQELLTNTGFINVKAQDKCVEFLEALNGELNKLQNKKFDFLEKFSEDDYYQLENGWLAKIRRATDGDQTWIGCYAEKSL